LGAKQDREQARQHERRRGRGKHAQFARMLIRREQERGQLGFVSEFGQEYRDENGPQGQHEGHSIGAGEPIYYLRNSTKPSEGHAAMVFLTRLARNGVDGLLISVYLILIPRSVSVCAALAMSSMPFQE
jgi:hypothetical protein